MSGFLKIGETSELLGVSIPTLRRWDKEGRLKPSKVINGTRWYSREQLEQFQSGNTVETDLSIIVAVKDQKSLSKLEEFLSANSYSYEFQMG